MKAVVRVLSVLALSSLLLPASLGRDTGKDKAGRPSETAKANSNKARAASSSTAKPQPGSTTAARPATPRLAAPRPKPETQMEAPRMRPVPATPGTLGLFTVETGQTLPVRGFSLSSYVNKFHRMPGNISVLNLGWSVGVGVHDRLSLFVQFEPHRWIHVSTPGQLSLNPALDTTLPFVGTTMYRRLSPTSGPGYVEDYPFAGHNGGSIGEITAGLKFALLSELLGDPVSLSVRNDFIFPTRSNFADLLENQNQTGQFNYGIHMALSKTWSNVATFAWNTGYRFTRDPRFAGGARAMTQADQFRVGAGFLFFPESRIQLITESTGLIFVGESAPPNTNFGARDPVDGLWGIRVYPWRNVALDVAYRYMLNLKQHGDRHGFVVKLGTAWWPEKPAPVNQPPSASCLAERTSVYAGTGEAVRISVQASDPEGDPLTYDWTATGGNVEGRGAEVRWNSAGTVTGSYTISVRVSDNKGGTASCAVDIRVEPRPNRAPSLSCSADRSSVLVGERVRITATASDPDGDQLRYAWRTNGGQIVGAGASVQLDTSGAAPGTYTVTGRVEDGRGGANDCSLNVSVQQPPPPPQASKLNECFFRAHSARVDNVCKRVLDDVALRLQNDPRARVVIVGYADPKERRPERLAAQRAENARKYLTEKGIAAGRVDVRAAGGQAGAGKQNYRIDIIWVPEGATY